MVSRAESFDLRFLSALAALGLVAFLIRFDLGRRYGFDHVDEPIVAALMQRAASGPISANWRGLPLEQWNHATLQFSPWTLTMQALGRIAGIRPIPSPAGTDAIDEGAAKREEERAIRLVRVASAVFGALTVIVVGLTAAALVGSDAAGLFAGAMLALAPLHVQDSLYARPEAMLALAVSMALGIGIRLLQSTTGDPRVAPSAGRFLGWLLLASLASGLAVSIKINAATIALWPLMVGLVAPGSPPKPLVIVVNAFGGLLGFLVGTPEFLIDPGSYFGGLAYEAKHYLRTGHRPHEAFNALDPNILWFADYMARLGFGPVPTLFAGWFALTAIFRGNRLTRTFAAWLLGTLVVNLLPRVRFERNLEVVLPALVIGAGVTASALLARTIEAIPKRHRSRRAPWLVIPLTLLSLGPSALTLLRFRDQIVHPVTLPAEFPAETEGIFHAYALIINDGWPMEASRAYIIHDPGDLFSRANLKKVPAIPGGGRRIIIESRWRAYNYPFSTIDFYHGPRRYIILAPNQPLDLPAAADLRPDRPAKAASP